jgi:integrase
MSQRLTDGIVRGLPAPATGNKIEYDAKVRGLGVRVTTAGARAFILNYRTKSGRERRYTIGSFPDWKVAAAREEAERLKRQIDSGGDPLADVQAERGAPTVADLCDRFEKEHLPKKRPSTQNDYKAAIERYIKPELKHRKVAEVIPADIDALHRKITEAGDRGKPAPYRANRVAAVLSKMFNLAIRWGWRLDNPVKGVERNQEHKRQRYLSITELANLTRALGKFEDQQAANVIRLLLLTGARRGEVRAARWADIDLEEGVWTKPGATTKQKTFHRVPLSAAAVQLLKELRKEADDDQEYVFPGRSSGHRVNVNDAWVVLCAAAKIKGARLHDLRHTYASVLASAGQSLPVIGALLGHTNPTTTHRYAHLRDDPLRQATETVGAIITGKPSADVVPLKGGRS